MNRNYFGFLLTLILSMVAVAGYDAFDRSPIVLAVMFLAILIAQQGGEEDQMNSDPMKMVYYLAVLAGDVMFVVGIIQGKIF